MIAQELISAINEKYETVSVEDITQMWKDILKSSGGTPGNKRKRNLLQENLHGIFFVQSLGFC